MSNFKSILFSFSLLAAVIGIDVAGYTIIEGAGIIDALYMTVISITTVGYTEVFPLSGAGKLFTIWVIISGLGIFFYIIGTIMRNTFEGNIRRILGRRKMNMLKRLNHHVVVAGFGIMGEHVCRELAKHKVKFVVIETDSERFALAEELGFNVIMGDATSEDNIENAGVENARTFISLLATDADNVYTVMAVREINPRIFIISRALDVANEKRLYKVGANRVISPYELGSRRIVNTVLRPNVVDFIDLMTYAPNMSLAIEELTVIEESPFNGKKVKDSGFRENFNIIVVAVKRGEEMFFNPSPDLEILSGDVLILVGEKDQLLKLY